MNWQKKLPGIGGIAVLLGVALLLVNSRFLSSPVHALDSVGWTIAGLGTLALLVGIAPPQIFSIFANKLIQ